MTRSEFHLFAAEAFRAEGVEVSLKTLDELWYKNGNEELTPEIVRSKAREHAVYLRESGAPSGADHAWYRAAEMPSDHSWWLVWVDPPQMGPVYGHPYCIATFSARIFQEEDVKRWIAERAPGARYSKTVTNPWRFA